MRDFKKGSCLLQPLLFCLVWQVISDSKTTFFILIKVLLNLCFYKKLVYTYSIAMLR